MILRMSRPGYNSFRVSGQPLKWKMQPERLTINLNRADIYIFGEPGELEAICALLDDQCFVECREAATYTGGIFHVKPANILVTAGVDLVADLQRRPWGLEDFRLTDPDGYYYRFTNRRTPGR